MHLSTRALWLAAAVLALGVAGQWLGGAWSDAWRHPAALALGLLLVEGVAARLRPLPARWQPPALARLGQPLQLQLRVGNPGRRPLSIEGFLPPPEGLDASSDVQRVAIAGGGEGELQLAGVPTRLGRLQWPGAELRLLGRYGLAWWTRRLPAQGLVTPLVPDSLGAAAPAVATHTHGAATRLHRGQGQELLGLRDYQPGDPLRAIDWKVSARRGQPVVREMHEEQHLELVLVLDVGRSSALQVGTLTRLHRAINAAARLAERAVLQGDRVALISYAQTVQHQLPALHGVSGLRRLRAALAATQTLAQESNPLLAAMTAQRLARQRSLLVWFADLEDSEAAGQLARAMQLLLPKHLPLLAALQDDELAAEALRTPRDWQDPYHAYAALQSLSALEAASRRLERLGCEVLRARPDRLDAALAARYAQVRSRRQV